MEKSGLQKKKRGKGDGGWLVQNVQRGGDIYTEGKERKKKQSTWFDSHLRTRFVSTERALISSLFQLKGR